MKKNFAWMLTAILICGLTAMVFTSCSKDDDAPSTPSTTVQYAVGGSLAASIPDATKAKYPDSWKSFGPVQDYMTAVDNIVPEKNTKDLDAEIKKACDAVYEGHMKLTGIIFKGSAKVTKTVKGKDTVIVWSKEY